MIVGVPLGLVPVAFIQSEVDVSVYGILSRKNWIKIPVLNQDICVFDAWQRTETLGGIHDAILRDSVHAWVRERSLLSQKSVCFVREAAAGYCRGCAPPRKNSSWTDRMKISAMAVFFFNETHW